MIDEVTIMVVNDPFLLLLSTAHLLAYVKQSNQWQKTFMNYALTCTSLLNLTNVTEVRKVNDIFFVLLVVFLPCYDAFLWI